MSPGAHRQHWARKGLELLSLHFCLTSSHRKQEQSLKLLQERWASVLKCRQGVRSEEFSLPATCVLPMVGIQAGNRGRGSTLATKVEEVVGKRQILLSLWHCLEGRVRGRKRVVSKDIVAPTNCHPSVRSKRDASFSPALG